MRAIIARVLTIALCATAASSATAGADSAGITSTQLGPRPYYLVDQMSPGPLKDELQRCAAKTRKFKATEFSIGHRGAPLLFPEHTMESYRAAASMGAGIIECDVTFTSDRQLVCRHDQCDLHTTTNIVATPLARQCTVPPVVVDGVLTNAAEIQCCSSDITLAQFKTLEGKMDAADTDATTIAAYLNGTSRFRTDLYSGGDRGTLMSHAEAVELFKQLGVGMTPELKTPRVMMPFQGDYTQEDYAQQLVDELVSAGVDPRRVWLQSFLYDDVLYWVNENPAFGEQAVFLDSRYATDVNDPSAVAALVPSMEQLAEDGVQILAPPLFMMLGVENGEIVASDYAEAATESGLKLIGWTTERSDQLENGGGGFYYSTVSDVIHNDGDILTVIDALARRAGVIGLFSDWPATTTFYDNCRKK